MDKKGQALVEFIIILPILLLFFFGSVDIARIVIKKNELEDLTTDVIEMYKENKSIDEIRYFVKLNNSDNNVEITKDSNYTTINLTTSVDIITPGLNLVLNSPYKIENKRVINYG